MITRLTFLLFLISTSFINAQIYTPTGVIQGSSTNDNIGIGTSNTVAKLTIQAGPDGYPAPLKAISILGPNTPENSYSAQAISWDFAAAGSAALRCYRGGSWDTYMQFLTNSNGVNGNNPQVRMHITGDGNIGMGTENIGFQTKLHVKESGSSSSIWRGRIVASGDLNAIVMGEYDGKAWLGAHNSQLNAWSNLIIQGGGGNVGIGAENPLFKLDINGVLNITSENNGGGLRFNSAVNGQTDSRNWYLSTDGYAYGDFVIKSSSTSSGTPDQIKLVIKSGGNLGLGTSNPDSKLTVKGKIHAEEVKIDLAVPADYVFEKYYLGESSLKPDYTFLTLSEVENFTAINHHLPNVPSAKDIKENGLLIGEMSNILLQKIEELTLYSINQKKTIEKLEKENESFKKLAERLSKIEKELEIN